VFRGKTTGFFAFRHLRAEISQSPRFHRAFTVPPCDRATVPSPCLAALSENAVAIASSGAIPPSAQLLKNDADDVTTSSAADALEAISIGIAANRAAAKTSADMVQATEGLGVDSPPDARTA
jgi:hypothetical protein